MVHGCVLVDMKIEFGVDTKGKFTVILYIGIENSNEIGNEYFSIFQST